MNETRRVRLTPEQDAAYRMLVACVGRLLTLPASDVDALKAYLGDVAYGGPLGVSDDVFFGMQLTLGALDGVDSGGLAVTQWDAISDEMV